MKRMKEGGGKNGRKREEREELIWGRKEMFRDTHSKSNEC